MNNILEERSNSFFDDIEIKARDSILETDPPLRLHSDSHNNSDHLHQNELSYYAIDIENVEDLAKSQKLSMNSAGSVATLRIMHCNNFASLKGIHIFSLVKDLNLSSNGIMSMSFLESLSNVETLNLSCNKIT